MSDLLSMHEAWLKDQQGRPENRNPMVKAFGVGPDGAVCRDCQHLVNGSRAIYWKCALRRISNCAASDHRKSWPACARFTRRPPAPSDGRRP